MDENKAGKYLTFKLAAEDNGISLLKVREIIGMMTIASVPRTPEYVKGVINLRSKVDTHYILGMANMEGGRKNPSGHRPCDACRRNSGDGKGGLIEFSIFSLSDRMGGQFGVSDPRWLTDGSSRRLTTLIQAFYFSNSSWMANPIFSIVYGIDRQIKKEAVF